MELSISNNIQLDTYKNRLQEPRQSDQEKLPEDIQKLQDRQRSDSAFQLPLQPAGKTGDIISLTGSADLEEKYRMYNSSGESDVTAKKYTEADDRNEIFNNSVLNTDTRTSGAATQQKIRQETGLDSGVVDSRKNAFPEAFKAGSMNMMAVAGYKNAGLQTAPVPTIDQTV